MSIRLDDVAHWVGVWEVTGEIISEAVARKIADYWHEIVEGDTLVAFADGGIVDGESLYYDTEAAIRYANLRGPFETIRELYALRVYALEVWAKAPKEGPESSGQLCLV